MKLLISDKFDKINVFKKNNLNFYLILVSSFSLMWFLIKEGTAYQWPAIDMVPFLKQALGQSQLVNDFFYNTSFKPNPRFIFGYVMLGIIKLFSLDWYTGLYTLKLILVITIPIAYFCFIRIVLKRYIADEAIKYTNPIIFLFIIAVIIPRIGNLFTIAWWPPFMVQATGQTLSLLIGLFGITMSEMKFKRISYFLFFISTLIHPAIGLFILIFYGLIIMPFLEIKDYFIQVLLGGFVPSILIRFLFKNKIDLESSIFVKIYAIDNHASHYHLSNFGTSTIFPWYFSLIAVSLLILIATLYYLLVKEIKLLKLSILFLISYLMSIVLQYLFIDIFPSKIVASLGLVRFTQFGYWMLVILYIPIVLKCFKKQIFFDKVIVPKIGGTLLLFLLIFQFIIGIILIDNPISEKRKQYEKEKTFDFISSLPENVVIASYPSDYVTDIPILFNRAIYSGNGFPFNEDYFQEFSLRDKLLYGDRADRDKVGGSWEGEKINNYYRSLLPKDFLLISRKYKLDYIIIEKEYSEKFNDYEPVFSNKDILIFKVNDFEKMQVY